MKKMTGFWVLLILAALLATGCGSKGGVDEDAAAGAQVEDRTGEGAQTAGVGEGGAWSGSALEDPSSPLYTKVILFDFDQSDIRAEYHDTLRAHASYLTQNGSVSMVVEGHCDERGSREYNIGLGERRANAVMRFLEAEGVDPAQINTLSYGEERPADHGHSEAAWAQNRRAVLVYQ